MCIYIYIHGCGSYGYQPSDIWIASDFKLDRSAYMVPFQPCTADFHLHVCLLVLTHLTFF